MNSNSLFFKLLVFYGARFPNHPRKWWVHDRLRKLLRAPVNEEFEVVREGLCWYLNPAEYSHSQLFWLGTKDRWDISNLKRLLRPESVIIDAGSNFGYYSLTLAAKLRSKCVIHALEPSPDNRALLCKNRDRNGLQGAVHIHPLGLADVVGRAKVLPSPEQAGHARLARSSEGPVPLTTLDKFCESRDIARLDWLILDVEGFEEQALRGGLATLARDHPAIFVELWPPVMSLERSSPTAVAALLRSLGYRLFRASRNRLVPLDDLPSGDNGINVFCFHPLGRLSVPA